MAAIQREGPVSHKKPKQSGSRYHYTSNAEMNEILTEFVQEAEKENIWVSMEASDLKENRIGHLLCELVGTALDTARRNCIETTPPRGRFIKFHSREMQQQLLIKIEFSCEDREIRKFDKNIVRIREIIEATGGYLKIQLEDETGSIRIAIPDETN